MALSRCWMPTMNTSITAAFKMGNRARKFSERPSRWVTYRLKKLVFTMLVMYRITDTATAFSTALSCSSRGMRWRYSPTMWKMDTPFVSARRTCLVLSPGRI